MAYNDPAIPRWAHLAGTHVDEWGRFTIIAPDLGTASRLAAELDWWLHCWEWQPGPDVVILDHRADLQRPLGCPDR